MHNSSMDYHRSRPANTRMPLKKHLKRTQAQLHELEHRLRPLSTELETLEQGVQKAKTLLDRALAKQDAEEKTHKARHAA